VSASDRAGEVTFVNSPFPLALACLLALLGTGCGPDALPRFANPPAVDAGHDATVEDDAGATEAEATAPTAPVGPVGQRLT
jgi:hypothetical protein